MVVTVSVFDGGSNQPIAGAFVFVNGASQGISDSNGQVTISDPPQAFDLTVKSVGFLTFTDSGNLSLNPVIPVYLQPAIGTSSTIFTLNIVPDADAAGIPITFSNLGNPIHTNYSPGGVTLLLASGLQIVTGNVPNYTPINATYDSSQMPSATVQLVAATDDGNQQALAAVSSQDPDPNSILPVFAPEKLPEIVPPNTGQGTYFTMTQARLYIGDLFIDELNYLQFALQNNKIPVYGYASRDFDAIAQGKSLVQGQFGINFVSEGYLVTALNEYQKNASNSALNASEKNKKQNQDRLLTLISQLQNPDPNWTLTRIKAAKQEIRTLASNLPPDAMQAANDNLAITNRKQINNILGYPGGDYDDVNATYPDIEFDIVIEYTGAGRTITRRLERCRIISNECVAAHDGNSIVDSYGFIARRLR